MLLLDRNYTDSLTFRNEQKSLKGNIDKRHHPLLILRIKGTEENHIITQTVICREKAEQMDINYFINGHWVYPTWSHSHNLERKVYILLAPH